MFMLRKNHEAMLRSVSATYFSAISEQAAELKKAERTIGTLRSELWRLRKETGIPKRKVGRPTKTKSK